MYSVRTPAPVIVVEDRIVIPQAPEQSGDSAVYAHLLVGEGTLEGSASAFLQRRSVMVKWAMKLINRQ